MEATLFGLTMKDLRELAYELSERNDIGHRFQNGKPRIGSMDFLRDILLLSVHKHEATSGARAMRINKVVVNSLFTRQA